jgi:hypothetical protein
MTFIAGFLLGLRPKGGGSIGGGRDLTTPREATEDMPAQPTQAGLPGGLHGTATGLVPC